MIAEISFAILAVLFIINQSRRPKDFPPGPRGLPLLGYFPFLSSWDPEYQHKAMKKLGDVYGPIVGLFMGPSLPLISVCSHEAIKEALLNEDLNGRPQSLSAQSRTFWEELGIMFVAEDFWKEQRRFTTRHLRDLGFGKTSIEDQMMDEVGDLIKDIEHSIQSSPDRVVDMKGIFQISVQNILWAIVAGERFQRDDPRFRRLLEANEKLFRAGNIVSSNLPVPAFLAKRFRFISDFLCLQNELVEPIQQFIQESIEDHKRNRNRDGARDFIDVYLNEIENQNDRSSTFTNNQLIAILMDLFSAGGESTSNTIGFAVLHLLRNQEIQRKMQAELDEVCGDSLPTLALRSKLPYTEAVLMEAMRCSSIAPFTVPHYAIRETRLQGYTIPKGSMILLNLYAVMQDPNHWKDPEVFRPERHLNEDCTKVLKADQFYPFGTGKRMCLAASLASNTYFLFTTALFKEFRVQPIPNEPLPSLEPNNGFTLGYKGFKAVVTPRF